MDLYFDRDTDKWRYRSLSDLSHYFEDVWIEPSLAGGQTRKICRRSSGMQLVDATMFVPKPGDLIHIDALGLADVIEQVMELIPQVSAHKR